MTQESELINSKLGGAIGVTPLFYLPPVFFLFFVLHETLLLYVKFIQRHFVPPHPPLPFKKKVMTSEFLEAGRTKKWRSSPKKHFFSKK